ncbi:MAG: STAS domain-containing protein [Saprospiraceae bacterium]|jgi:anti-sigma B factor antagonist|nr:STAS domain-containing protein [Saprospiraceae bacterium]
MKYTIDKREKLSVLTLDEENLNSLIAPDLKSDLLILKNEGINNLVVDLSKVKYVDSSGLSAILTGNRMWKDSGSFVVTGIESPMVKKLIEISKLDTVLSIVSSMEEAVGLIHMEEIERDMNAGE